MEEWYGNLHFHSTHSDGVYTPEELVKRGIEEGYRALVLTDHDVANGAPKLRKACEEHGIETLMGAEFYCSGLGHGFHMLGLDFDPNHPEMAYVLDYMSKQATFLARVRFDNCLAKGYFCDITWDEVVENSPDITWFCNEHVFRTLQKKGMWKKENYFDFFVKFMSYTPKYNPYKSMDVKAMISLIREAGGVAVLAHPHDQLDHIAQLVDWGMQGVECSHHLLTAQESDWLRNYATAHSLYITGGTDHHGYMGGNEDRFPPERSHVIPRRAFGTSEKDFRTLKERRFG